MLKNTYRIDKRLAYAQQHTLVPTGRRFHIEPEEVPLCGYCV
jgi:hypothetical protein